MVTANLTFTQSAVSPGAGISMFGAAGAVVTLSNSLNSGVKTWIYELLDVPISSAIAKGVISSGTTPTATFTPDNPATPGCYRVKLTVVGLDGSRSSMIRNFCVQTAQGWVLASFRSTAAELNFGGNTDGWETYLNTILLSLSAGAPSSVLRNNTIFVSKNGLDGTGTRNSLTTPFLTIQAALNAAQEGDTVYVASGTYAEGLVWPEIDFISLIGAPGAGTIIMPASETHAITIAPAAVAVTGSALIKDLVLYVDSASGVDIDCTTQPTSFEGGITIDNCTIINAGTTRGLYVRTCNQLTLKDLQTKDVDWDIKDLAKGYAYDSLVSAITLDWDSTGDPPSEARNAFACTGVQASSVVTVNNEAWLGMGKDCQMASVLGSLGDDAAENTHGIIDIQGRVVGSVAITFTFLSALGGTHRAVKFEHADLGSTFSVADGGTSTQRCQATAHQAIFRSVTDRTINAGDWCDLDLRGSIFTQDAIRVTGSGAIDRSVWQQDVPAATAMPHTMTFADSTANALPYPDLSGYGVTEYPYSVLFEGEAAVDFPQYVTNPKTTSKPNTGGAVIFNGGQNPSAGITRVTILRQFDGSAF